MTSLAVTSGFSEARKCRGKMAESSLFAQRLQAITERRRLQERILSTRRELEEERLRAQRLKRKSLRDRWLMEGTAIPTDDNDHTSSSWKAQTRIQELEQDLSSLESQMQQLDNPELRQGQRQLEETVKAVKEVKPSLDGIGKVDGTSPASPEGRSSTKSRPELAPVPPKRPMRAAAKEKLQNGDMSGVGPFGSQCSPDKVDIKMSPMVTEAGDLPSHLENSEAAPAPKPAWQNLNPSEAPAGRQRKRAVEEMVIRDHLGQEVGSMDAVGQKQRSIGKEEELEDHADLGNSMLEEQGRPAPCILDQEKALEASETQVDSELGSRDGPEGQSPTSQDLQSPSKPLQAENSSLKQQAEVGLGSLAKGAALMEVEQKELPEQSAKEMEPTKDLVASDAPAAEPVRWEQEKPARKQGLQEPQGLETTVVEPGGERGESWLDHQPTPLLLASVPPVPETKVPSSLEETKIPLLDPVLSSSLPDQISLTLQDQIPPLQDAKGSLLDQIPSSFQETEGSLLDPVLSLSTQSPSTLLDQTPPLQESKESPLCQIPSSFQESLLDSNPPSHQHHISSSPEQKPPSLQGDITFPQETKHSLLDQVPSSLNEANGQLLDQIPTSLQDQSPSLPNQIPSPLPDQFAAPLEVDSALPGQILSSLPEMERSLQISTALQGQELSVQEAKLLPDLTPSSINQQPSLPDKVTSLQEAKRSSLDEIPLTLQDQMPTPSVQNFSQPEANIFLPGQIPSSVDETKYRFPGETPVSVLDQIPPALQDQKPAFLEDKTFSSLQEIEGSLPDRIQTSLPSPTSPSLPEATGSSPDQAQPTLREEMPIPLPGQTPCLQEAEKSLPDEQIPSSLPEEMPTLSDQALTPNKLQSSTLQDTATLPDVLPLSTQEPVQSTLDKTAPEKNQDLKEGGDANLVTAATAEVTEVLGNLHAEQQPLLEECKAASVAPPDTSIGDLQSKTEILKPLVATSQEAPTYTTTSANTASSSQLQPAVPCQGEDQAQGQSRRKHKSCQCCSVM